jgi:hypothetical protein
MLDPITRITPDRYAGLCEAPRVEVRRAPPAEAGAIAELWLRWRAAAVPDVPPPVHTSDEVRVWFKDVVFLDINGTDPTVASNDDVYEVVMRVAADPVEIDELAQRLRVILSANG